MEERTRKGQRGWVKQDISQYVGQRFGQLVILGRAESKDAAGNCRVRCLCDCGTEFDTRLAGVLGGRTKSCGHLRAEAYKEHWNRQAAKLPVEWARSLFLRLCAGQWSDAVAQEIGLDKRLIEGAFRVHAQRLLATYEVTLDEGLLSPRSAAKAYGLTLAEYMYLRRQVRKARPDEPLVVSAEDASDLWRDASDLWLPATDELREQWNQSPEPLPIAA